MSPGAPIGAGLWGVVHGWGLDGPRCARRLSDVARQAPSARRADAERDRSRDHRSARRPCRAAAIPVRTGNVAPGMSSVRNPAPAGLGRRSRLEAGFHARPRNPAVTSGTLPGKRQAMKVLVLTSEPITADQLRGALDADVEPSDSEVMVVAPAYAESGLKFWMSDADDAIAKAEQVRRDSVQELDKAGVPASGDTGESDPETAIEDALKTFDADRIVVFTHEGEAQRYREDVDWDEVAERFGRPVDQAAV